MVKAHNTRQFLAQEPYKTKPYLEDALIEYPEGNLKCVVGSIIERPGPADRHPHLRADLEHLRDPRLAELLRRLVQHPVRVPPVDVERPPIEHELGAIPLHEAQLRASRRGPEVPKREVDEDRKEGDSKKGAS